VIQQSYRIWQMRLAEFGRFCLVDISVAPRYFEKLFSWAILLAQGALDPHFTNEKKRKKIHWDWNP